MHKLRGSPGHPIQAHDLNRRGLIGTVGSSEHRGGRVGHYWVEGADVPQDLALANPSSLGSSRHTILGER